MAITITKDNKTIVLRNLEEQVLENKEDIAKLNSVGRVIANWGIKVLGVVPTVENIPVATYEYGDAFGLSSTNPMQYVVWTRANANVGEAADYWLNIGALSLVGPQGPQGIQGNPGPTGKRGSLWTATSGGPTVVGANFLNGDLWLNATNGDVYQYIADDQRWSLKGNIRGPQGVQGPTGPKGEQGIQGPTGPQGPKGDTGSSFKIGGLLESVDNLPTPTEANRSIGYAIRNQDGVTYDLYVVVGTDNLQWVNMGRVEGVQGPQGPEGPQGPAGVGATIIPISSTSKGGTLNPTQLQTIRTATYPIINLNNEYFVKADIYDSENEFVFSHLGQKDSSLYTKAFRLNTQSGDWEVTEQIVRRIIDFTQYWNESDEQFKIPKELTKEELIQSVIYAFDKFYYFASLSTDPLELYFKAMSNVYIPEDGYRIDYYEDGIDIFSVGTDNAFAMLYEYAAGVRVVTSAQIIEDQGKIEIATYSNNQIVDINDTPNQFLQRRLDKPNKKWDGQELDGISDDLEILRDNGTLKIGVSFIKIKENNDNLSDTVHYTIYLYQGPGHFDQQNEGTKWCPLSIILTPLKTLITEITISDYTNQLKFLGYNLVNADDEERVLDTVDLDTVELFY